MVKFGIARSQQNSLDRDGGSNPSSATILYKEGLPIIPITKNEAKYLASRGYKYKADIIKTLNGRNYYLKESNILLKEIREYRESMTIKK